MMQPCYQLAVLFGHAGLCERQGEKASHWLYSACYQPPSNTEQCMMRWSSPLVTHEKAGSLISSLPRSTQASCSAGSLISPSLSQHGFVFHSVHRHFDSLSVFLIQHIQCEHLRWICALFFKPKLYFCGLFCVWCTQTPMINKCL